MSRNIRHIKDDDDMQALTARVRPNCRIKSIKLKPGHEQPGYWGTRLVYETGQKPWGAHEATFVRLTKRIWMRMPDGWTPTIRYPREAP